MANRRIHTILIGTSLTEASDEVVLNGMRLARAAGARVHLVHAFDLTRLYSGATFVGGTYIAEVVASEHGVRLQRLKSQAARVGIGPELLAGVTAQEGAPHLVIIDAAARLGADLIVAGAVEHWPRMAKLIGSTADRVLRAATCPVLLTRGSLVVPPRRVEIAVDLSPASGDALDCGLQVLSEVGAGPGATPPTEIEALFVLDRGCPDPTRQAAGGQSIEQRAREALGVFLDGHRPDPAWTLAGRVQTGAGAGSEILARCQETQPDLIVVGTHGRGGFARFLTGSVADSVLRHAQTSVLVVPPRTARGAAPRTEPARIIEEAPPVKQIL